MLMNASEIDRDFKEQFAALVKKHKGYDNVPRSEINRISEIMRARHVALVCAERSLGPLPRVLRDYGVSDAVIADVAGEVPEVERKQKRVDKYKTIFDWCCENTGKETTVYEIAEVGGISYSTANNLVKDRIDYFKKVKKGLYVIRNPQAERAEEKK